MNCNHQVVEQFWKCQKIIPAYTNLQWWYWFYSPDTWVYWRPEYIGDLVLGAILCGRSTLWWDSFNIKYSLQGKQFYPSSLTDISTMFPVSPYTSHYTSHFTDYTLCSVHMLSGSSSGCRGVVIDGLMRPTSVYTASIRGLLSTSKSLS